MPKPTTNARVFAVLMIFTQISLAALNGVFIRPLYEANQTVSLKAIFQPFVIGILTVLGFGLLFSYNKKLIWSGLGYTFFITAFVLQLYPLINAFWLKTQIMGETIRGTTLPLFSDDDKSMPYFLSRSATTSFFENHVVQAFKCAIAVSVAFSCILGRAGSLECWIMVVLGTIGFQETRQICYRLYQTTNNLYGDAFGTMNVFTFGGFMGLGAGFILYLRQHRQASTSTMQHQNYTANSFSAAYALLGTIILVICLPFMIFTWHQTTTIANLNPFLFYTPVLCVILSVSGSTLTTVALGLILKGRLVVRHLVYGPVAGAVIGGASSYYISNPVYATLIGCIGGAMQTVFMVVKQNRVENGWHPVTTVSFTLFGLQGLVGSAIAIGWKQIIQSNSNGLPYTAFSDQSAWLILHGLICAGMGLGFGILAGVLIILINNHLRSNHFTDRTYWAMEDGISELQLYQAEEQFQQYIEGDQIKNQHAYL